MLAELRRANRLVAPSRGNSFCLAFIFAVIFSMPVLTTARLTGRVAHAGEWLIQAETFLTQRRILDAVPEDPSEAITPGDWNSMVSEVFGLAPGDDGVEGSCRNLISANTDMLAAEGKLSRAAAVHGLVTLLKLCDVIDGDSGSSSPPRFSDWNEVPERYREALSLALSEKLVNGFPGGKLEPLRPLSIGEGLALLHRACDQYDLLDRLLMPAFSGVNGVTKIEDGIEITVYTDKETYDAGDVVSIVATLENRGQAVTFRIPFHGAPGVSLRAWKLNEDGGGFGKAYPIEDGASTSPLKEGEIELRLDSGSIISRRATWIPPLVQKEEGTADYFVEAYMRVMRPKGFGWLASRLPVEEVRAGVNVKIEPAGEHRQGDA